MNNLLIILIVIIIIILVAIVAIYNGLVTARNKVKKLREVLCGDMHGITRFLENAADIEAVLKEETAKREVSAQDFFECVSGSKEEATIFIDAIEIIDFLPKKKDR